jgi:hypothetical protein
LITNLSPPLHFKTRRKRQNFKRQKKTFFFKSKQFKMTN